MSYSIVDFFISNIPIFVPSIEFLVKNNYVNDRTLQSNYCNKKTNDIEHHENSIHQFSPNDDSGEAIKYWLTYADYFQWPYVTVFESFEDLIEKLNTVNLREMSNKMKNFNKVKEANILDNWCRVLKHDTKDSNIPMSFQEAVEYFQL